MSELQSVVLIACAVIGCGALAWLVKIGKAIVHGIEDVPKIMPLHLEVVRRLDGIDRRLAVIDARAVLVKVELDAEATKVRDALEMRIAEGQKE